MNALDELLQKSLGTVFTTAGAEVRQRGAVMYRATVGSLDLAGERASRVRRDTLFDLGSLTALYTALAFFRLVDSGRVMLDMPVAQILPTFGGLHALNPDHQVPIKGSVDAGSVTFRHLLAHSSGLPASIDLRHADTPTAGLEMCLKTSFAYPVGARIVYSAVGYIVLGMAIARITDSPLESAMKRLVQQPLDLAIRYGQQPVGSVHDPNAAALGGIAGHAGLFGTANDVALIGQLYLADGGGFISPRLAREAVRAYLGGWIARLPEGSRLSPASYGHTDSTGNSLWIDPERRLACALLTNHALFGRDNADMVAFRSQFHDALIELLEGSQFET